MHEEIDFKKNGCPGGGLCYNRGCGMYHENCHKLPNMENLVKGDPDDSAIDQSLRIKIEGAIATNVFYFGPGLYQLLQHRKGLAIHWKASRSDEDKKYAIEQIDYLNTKIKLMLSL